MISANRLLTAIIILAVIAGCDGKAGGNGWQVKETTNKLDNETVMVASVRAQNDEKTATGDLELECHLPSKVLAIRLSSYAAKPNSDGTLAGAKLLGVPDFRFGSSTVAKLNDVLPTRTTEYNNQVLVDLEEARLTALLFSFGKDLVAKVIDAKTKVATLTKKRDSGTTLAAWYRTQLSRAIADSATMSCTSYIEKSDCWKHPAGVRTQVDSVASMIATDSVEIARMERFVDSVKALPGYSGREAFWKSVAGGLPHIGVQVDSTLESLASMASAAVTGARMTMLSGTGSGTVPEFGDLMGVASGAAFLEKLGPELVFGYSATGGKNTLVLPVNEKSVKSVINRCR